MCISKKHMSYISDTSPFLLQIYYPTARISLTCGTFKLICDRKANGLWVTCATEESENGKTMAMASVEVFGFGSGDWVSKSTARDVMSDCSDSGRWLPFTLKDGNQRCIIEMDRRSPDHVKKADIHNKVF